MKQLGCYVLATKRSVGVIQEVNLRNLLHAGDEACTQEIPHWLWNPGQTSPEVQNRAISGPSKIILKNYNLILNPVKKEIVENGTVLSTVSRGNKFCSNLFVYVSAS